MFLFWEIYPSSGISLSCSFVTVSELFCCEFFETFVILPSYDLATASAILLPIRSSVASSVFWIALFEAVLNAFVAFFFFFYLDFLSQPFTSYRTAGEGRDHSLTPHYHFHPLHRHLGISCAITAESLSLHIGSSQTRTRNLWFPGASHWPLSYVLNVLPAFTCAFNYVVGNLWSICLRLARDLSYASYTC